MITPLMIAVFVVAAIFFLALKFFKHAIKTITIGLVILLFLAIGIIFLVGQEASEFIQTFQDEDTTYVLVEQETIITGFQARTFNASTFEALTKNELENRVENQEGIIVFVDNEILESEALDEFITSDEEEIQARAFMLSFFETVQSQGALSFLDYIRSEDIRIEPDTLIVRLMVGSPRQVFKETRLKLVQTIQDSFVEVKEEVEDEFSR